MRTRCEACGRRWGAEEPLGLKAEATVASCAMCDVRSKLEDRLRSGPPKPSEALLERLGKLLPANVYGMDGIHYSAAGQAAAEAAFDHMRQAREKLGHPALGAVVYVRQETLDELKRLPPARADHITPMHALAHSFERIEVRVWDEKRLGPITDEELARINDLIERGVLKA